MKNIFAILVLSFTTSFGAGMSQVRILEPAYTLISNDGFRVDNTSIDCHSNVLTGIPEPNKIYVNCDRIINSNPLDFTNLIKNAGYSPFDLVANHLNMSGKFYSISTPVLSAKEIKTFQEITDVWYDGSHIGTVLSTLIEDYTYTYSLTYSNGIPTGYSIHNTASVNRFYCQDLLSSGLWGDPKYEHCGGGSGRVNIVLKAMNYQQNNWKNGGPKLIFNPIYLK